MSTDQERVLSRRYDIAGNSILRQTAHWVRIKTSIMGYYDSGPGLRCLLTLAFLHYAWEPLFRLGLWVRSVRRR